MNASEIDTNRLVDDLKNVTRDAEELLKAVGAERGNGAHQLRMRLNSAIESAKTTYRRMEGKAVEGAKATDKVIRTHPYESLGIVFGLGLLVGVLARRK